MGDVALEMGLDNGQDFHRWDREGQQLQAMAQQDSHRRADESQRSHERHSCPPLQPILYLGESGPSHFPGLSE